MNTHTTYPTDVLFDIETLINVAQPSSILLLGDHSVDFLDTYLEQKALIKQPCEITHIASADIALLNKLQQRFDVSIALNLFEHIDKTTGTQILSRLRDVLSPQYCICLPISPPNDKNVDAPSWRTNELFGFALKRVASYQHNEIEYGLFKYNIDDYKNTPDWLNSDNWANPEMWDKYWW